MNNDKNRAVGMRRGDADPRVGRTRELLVDAFVRLCGEKKNVEVTVSDITRRAGVNRATFYRHFEDKADLIERGIDQLLATVFSEIDSVAPVGSDESDRIIRRITRFFEIIHDRSSLFRNLMTGNGHSVISEKSESFVVRFLSENRLSVAGEEALTMPLPLASRVLTAMLFTFAAWWLDHPASCTAREVASFYLNSSMYGLLKV